MKQTTNSQEPDCPGKTLQDKFLKPQSITQKHLNKATGISSRHIREIISGRRAITPDTAIRLSKFFKTRILNFLIW